MIISEGTQTEVELSVVRTVLWCRGDGSINTCVVVSPITGELTNNKHGAETVTVVLFVLIRLTWTTLLQKVKSQGPDMSLEF